MADTPEHEQSKIETKSEPTRELPAVESPSISPAVAEPAPAPKIETAAEPQPAIEPVAAAKATSTTELAAGLRFPRHFKLRPRRKRYAIFAASVAFAAACGAVVGSLASGGFAAPKQQEINRADDGKAMQQTIARLSKDIATLKANLDGANKTAQAQIARITDKLNERLARESADITGSISAPQTVPSVPLPKPAQRAAFVEPPTRPSVVADWIIRNVRDGYVYVQGHGDIYQVSIGAPLPGLGAVEQVRRQDGRWMVVTPKGIIVSLRDRRYFESF